MFANVNYVKNATQTCDSCVLLKVVREGLKKENERLQNLLNESIVRVRLLEEENSNLQNLVYSYQNLPKNGQLFKKTTVLEKESFDILFEFLDPGENSCKLNYYDNAKEIAQKTGRSSETPSRDTLQKRGPRSKMDAKNQLFMCLSWLKNGFAMSHVAWLFDTPKSTVPCYIITWINFMYFTLGSLPIWPSIQQIDESMPETFKQAYPNTQCIIDCTELFCPSSLFIQSSLYSSYKHHVTYKGLIGIAPSGAVTFISNLYPGSISDKEITHRSGLLNEALWAKNDSIMADRGFLISDDLEILVYHLYQLF